MAHDIYIPKNVEVKPMVFSHMKPMWHNLTEPIMEALCAEEVMNLYMGGGFPIHKRPVSFMLNGKQTTKDYALVRGSWTGDPEEHFMEFCTEQYNPMQPIDVARLFDMKVNVPVETMFFLAEGEEMVITWAMPEFQIKPGDEISLYGLIKIGFNARIAANLFTSTFRAVCRNTTVQAQGWADANTDGRGRGNIWKGRGTNPNLPEHLGYWLQFVQDNAIREANLVENFFRKAAEMPIKNDMEAVEILNEAFPSTGEVSAYYPPELRNAKVEKVEAFNEGQHEMIDGIMSLFKGAGTAITPDYYGLLNSTSEYFCHIQPSKKAPYASALFGARSANINKVMSVLKSRM